MDKIKIITKTDDTKSELHIRTYNFVTKAEIELKRMNENSFFNWRNCSRFSCFLLLLSASVLGLDRARRIGEVGGDDLEGDKLGVASVVVVAAVVYLYLWLALDFLTGDNGMVSLAGLLTVEADAEEELLVCRPCFGVASLS